MLYTVGEMAKVLGVPTSTLRYYDQEGLLPFVERSNGGIRMFTYKDYEGLKVIQCLKKSGLTIKQIRQFIEMASRGNESIKERFELFRSRREEVKKQLKELKETLDLLEYKCWYYETAIESGDGASAQSYTLEKIPEQYREARKSLDINYSNIL